MRWPWTSRARLDDALGQVEYFRGQLEQERAAHAADVASLQDQLVRISRHEAGLPEVPRPPKPVLSPMPRELAEYIEGFASHSLRKSMRDVAFRRHAAGEQWGSIVQSVMDGKKGDQGDA